MSYVDEHIARFERAIFVMGNIVRAQATISGMNADNQLRALNGESPAWSGAEYDQVIQDCGIHHNELVTRLLQGK